MTRVLVTGSTGFIGGPVVEHLRSLGHEVHAAARSGGGRGEGVAWHDVDLLAPDGPDRLAAAAQPEALVHLAWCAEPTTYLTTPENLAWVGASARLLVAVHATGCRRTVVAGTCLEYEVDEHPADERLTAIAPTSPYAMAKHGLNTALTGWASAAGHSLAWARIFHLFGPGEPPSRLVPTVARAALTGGRAALSAGTQARDFLDVDDVAGAIVAILSSSVEGPVNVASGVATTVADLAAMVAAAAGDPECLDLGAVTTADAGTPTIVGATGRLSREVGWHPGIPLDAAVERAVRWWSTRVEP